MHLSYKLTCPLCKGNHTLAGCPRWRAQNGMA